MPKDYYIILGIPATSSQQDIKDAYRRLAKEFHPDHYGENKSPFQSIQEAYAVLSDPAQRKAYDAKSQVRQPRRSHVSSKVPAEPIKPQSGIPVEPLSPERSWYDGDEHFQKRPFHQPASSWGDHVNHLFETFVEDIRATGEVAKRLNVEISLTPDQAYQGGHVKILVSTNMYCPVCRGIGRLRFDALCRRCGGSGMTPAEIPLVVTHPPHLRDNQSYQYRLRHPEIEELLLTITFRVQAASW